MAIPLFPHLLYQAAPTPEVADVVFSAYPSVENFDFDTIPAGPGPQMTAAAAKRNTRAALAETVAKITTDRDALATLLQHRSSKVSSAAVSRCIELGFIDVLVDARPDQAFRIPQHSTDEEQITAYLAGLTGPRAGAINSVSDQ